MAKVRLTVLDSHCRCSLHRTGDTFIVEDICPPLCHELWHIVYPMVYTLLNGGELDCGDKRGKSFTAACPDGGRVLLFGETIES